MRLVQAAYNKANVGFDVDFIPLHGHCCTLAAPEDYNSEWKTWKMEHLPIIPDVYKHVPVEVDLVKTIKKQIKENDYDGLINCTDPEREGQNIFYSLYDYLGLKLPVLRFWQKDLTEAKLIEAWHDLKDDQNDTYLKNLTEASLLRAEADWLIGMNFSRAVSINNHKVIPVGRVMTVVLAILAKREEEIKNFKPVDTYDVIAKYKEGFDGKYNKKSETGGAFEKKDDAQKFIDSLDKKGTVTSAERKDKTSAAPLLYSLGDLQNDANKHFGYTLNDSLQIIQDLYEKKLLSYPRTDSQYLTTGEAKRIRTIVDACYCIPGLDKFPLVQDKVDNYAKTKYVNDKKVQAHYAIVLTGTKFKFEDLSEKEKNIMTLVAKRIIGTLMEDSVSLETEIKVDISGNEFLTKESVITTIGWKVLNDEKIAPTKLGKINKGDVVNVNEFELKTVTSTCPPRFNDASLNKAMINVGTLIEDKELAEALKGETKDQGGIGTPATRAGIVEKLLVKRKDGDPWVSRKGKSFVVSENGLDIYHMLKDYSVSSPVLTAQWEKKLGAIEDGNYQGDRFEKELNEYITKEVESLKNAKTSLAGTTRKGPSQTALSCPWCNGVVMESENYYYCENYGKEEGKCSFIIGKTTAGAKINQQDVTDLLMKGKTTPKMFVSKAKKKFSACLSLNKETKKIEFVFDKLEDLTDIVCQCGGRVTYKSGKFGPYYQCSSCNKIVSEKYGGKKLSKKIISALYNGDEVLLENLKSKSGKTYSAYYKLNDKLELVRFADKKEK